MKKITPGFTLIELLVFVVVLGIIASIPATAYLTVLRNSNVVTTQMKASKAASTCMDWYTGERYVKSFDSTNLVCGSAPTYIVTTPTFCTNTTPAGYTTTTKIDCSTLYSEPGQYKTITVTVTGNTPTTKTGNASVSTVLAKY